MSQTIPKRIVIYAKDIMNITGRKEATAKKLFAQIRKKYKKKRGEYLTVKEFCHYTGFDEETVYKFLAI